MFISNDIIDVLISQARQDAPNETCGYLLGITSDEGDVVTENYWMENIDHSPEHFSFAPKDQFAALKYARQNGLKILANWHSHPASPSRPSQEDLRLANDPTIRYAILSLHEGVHLNSFKILNGEVDTKTIEILERNVRQLSRQTEQETRMMPQTEASLPSVEQVQKIINLVKSIIFPDYFNKRQCHETIRSYNIGVHMEELLQTLARQISYGLQFGEKSEAITSRQQVQDKARDLALQLIDALPEIKRLLYTDVQAMFDNDPAAINYGEIIFSYPVTKAMIHYRIAHKLHELQVPVIPRIITELAHSETGIDIHPGAQISEYFAIDHGTGVVIGETCIIGSHVTLYQGVTLGSKSFKKDSDGNMLNIPRHPIIEDNVTIYSNASILGRITIGHDSVIGGNIWVTHDVAPNSRVQQSKAVERHFEGGLGI